MTELRLYKSKKKALVILLLAIPLIYLGVWLIVRENSSETDRIMGWIGTIFFSLGIPVGLFHFFDKRPQVIINEKGIYDRTTHKDFILWEWIQEAYPVNIYGQHFICLAISEEFRPSKKKGKWHQFFAKINETIGAQELNINVSQLQIDTFLLTDFVIAMTLADAQQKVQLIKELPSLK